MITLNLVHSVHGIIASKNINQSYKYDSLGVKSILNKWKKRFGKKYLQCETQWEN